MDLLSTIRKTGSRGGVNFSWDEVANSSHRENYLGHSLKAPVGRWAKGRDLNWYAKSDATPADSAETDEERKAREHKEELRRIKEAEEDAMARALGLPPPVRTSSGANAVDVEPKRQVGPASGPPRDAGRDESRSERSRRHGDDRRERRRHRDRSKSRSRSRSPDRRRDRDHRRRSRDRAEGRDDRDREHRHRRDRDRSRSRDRRDNRRGDGKGDRHDERRHRDRSRERHRSRSREHRRRSPGPGSRRDD
ncbi:kinase phosphorylation domain-containing protein [Trichoderma longibrachiatum]